jgi:hypothetical protein
MVGVGHRIGYLHKITRLALVAAMLSLVLGQICLAATVRRAAITGPSSPVKAGEAFSLQLTGPRTIRRQSIIWTLKSDRTFRRTNTRKISYTPRSPGRYSFVVSFIAGHARRTLRKTVVVRAA